MRGYNPEYLHKFDEGQQKFLLSGYGRFFYDEFICRKGNHLIVPGTTGSGKTNCGYWLVNFLKFSEKQIWYDSGKSNEILPLLCLGMPVQIICPKYHEIVIEERINGKWEKIKDHPAIVSASDAGDTWWSCKNKTINIISVRNAFWTTEARAQWMTESFRTLADWTRLRRMPPGFYPCSIHIDETQWALSGTRITRDEDRVKSSEVITENATEIRSSGGRLIMYVQDFMNLPPAVRQNLVCAILRRGAEIKSEQSKKLSLHCFPPPGSKAPANFKRNEGKFVSEDGRSSPYKVPWPFALMPKSQADRDWIARCRVRYVGFHDQEPKEAELQEELFPELGRFSALAIPPEKAEVIKTGRYEVIADE